MRVARTFGAALLAMTFAGFAPPRLPVDILQATDKLPARLVEPIESPRGYVETSAGVSLVLDGGSHAVFAIDRARGTSKRIIDVGAERGRILSPGGFSLGPNDILAITDAPGGNLRVQYFGDDGKPINSLYLAVQSGVRVSFGRVSLRSAGALAFTGRTFILNSATTGALMSEFDATGVAVRSIGALRPTGQESDPVLHQVLNAGIPLVDPTGGLMFVFEAGTPAFRKYSADGTLLFERHIEGAELDAAIASIPTNWARQRQADVWPVAPAFVQAAAVDRHGRLWVSLTLGYTYVFDPQGDKIRTAQFRAGNVDVSPTSLFFTRDDRLLVTPGCYEFRMGH